MNEKSSQKFRYLESDNHTTLYLPKIIKSIHYHISWRKIKQPYKQCYSWSSKIIFESEVVRIFFLYFQKYFLKLRVQRSVDISWCLYHIEYLQTNNNNLCTLFYVNPRLFFFFFEACVLKKHCLILQVRDFSIWKIRKSW